MSEILELLKKEYEENDQAAAYLPSFEVVEEGDWVVEHKYEICDIYVKHKHTEDYFCITLCRSGSYFSDYDYNDTEFFMVKPLYETKVVRTWLGV